MYHNIKVLLISTSLNDRVIKECFWKEKAKKQNPAMLGGIMMPPMGIEKSGVEEPPVGRAGLER